MSATFNTFDLIFISFSLLFIVVAFFRGFVKEFFSLLIWIAALAVSYFGAPIAVKLLSSYSGNKMVLDIICRLMLFIATFFALLLSTSSLIDDIKDKMPVILDRSLGVLYGIGKTLLVFGTLYAITANLYGFLLGKKEDPDHKKVPTWMVDAKFGKILKITGEAIDPAVEAFIEAITDNFKKPGMLPESLDDKIDEVVDEDEKKSLTKDHDIDFEARPDKISFQKKQDASDKIDIKKTDSKKDASSDTKVEKETGYDKKNIDKLGRLIDVIDKTN